MKDSFLYRVLIAERFHLRHVPLALVRGLSNAGRAIVGSLRSFRNRRSLSLHAAIASRDQAIKDALCALVNLSANIRVDRLRIAILQRFVSRELLLKGHVISEFVNQL